MLDIKYIQSLIADGVEESLELEYKAAGAFGKSDSKKQEITKDVSAFANSSGGRIIYGVKEYDQKDKRHLPEKVDPINRGEFSKEWVEHVINNIRPRLRDVVIHTIEVTENVSYAIFVIDVPMSDTAHQALDKKYYKRYNFESVPMYDHEIRDVMARNIHPSLELKLPLDEDNPRRHPLNIPSIKVLVQNVGSVYAKYVNCYINLPGKICFDNLHEININTVEERSEYFFKNTIRDIVGFKPSLESMIEQYGPSWFSPILPGLAFEMGAIRLVAKARTPEYRDEKILWTLHADNAKTKKGVVHLSEIEGLFDEKT